ncbi:MAG: type II toxin-antitoxin system RelE/ParE family toxin [Nitrospirae bacterium]|nr:type II toxin-antitoxin system RelE/ParE family toxin [Nitrospirota bacterium]
MPFKVDFIAEAENDFDALDGAVRKEAAKKIDSLAGNLFLGKPLGNKLGINLTGWYKLYFVKKKYRIVYRIIGEDIEIVEIIAIGRRDKEEVYKMAAKRLKKLLKM